MVVAMVTAFIICWGPYAIVSMYNVFNLDNQVRRPSQELFDLKHKKITRLSMVKFLNPLFKLLS